MVLSRFTLLFLISIAYQLSKAESSLECYTFIGCGSGRSNSVSSNPSTSNQIRINPSAVPTEKSIGLEGIYFNKDTDLSLVQGLGRVGAAISPSNSEETFFGPPGFEIPSETLTRKQNSEKYPSQKINLAAAFDVIKKKGSGLKSYGLKLGAIGKYNKFTNQVHPGAGLTAVLGPFLAGASFYNDETQLDYTQYGLIPSKVVTEYQVQTYSAGISLSSLLVDYSVLRLEEKETKEVSTVRVTTASLLVKKLILTASRRIEESERDAYNYSTETMEVKKIKEEYFGGIQYNLTRNFMLGALYNYYLLREYSATATLFF
jgi:hypothetical protein